jgi:hypothetical protein
MAIRAWHHFRPEHHERREHERAQVALQASAWSLVSPTKLHVGTTVDISSGGALLHLPGIPKTAAMLTLQVDLPEHPLAATAVVVRRGEDNTAVAWRSLSREDRDRLFRLAQAEPVSDQLSRREPRAVLT